VVDRRSHRPRVSDCNHHRACDAGRLRPPGRRRATLPQPRLAVSFDSDDRAGVADECPPGIRWPHEQADEDPARPTGPGAVLARDRRDLRSHGVPGAQPADSLPPRQLTASARPGSARSRGQPCNLPHVLDAWEELGVLASAERLDRRRTVAHGVTSPEPL